MSDTDSTSVNADGLDDAANADASPEGDEITAAIAALGPVEASVPDSGATDGAAEASGDDTPTAPIDVSAAIDDPAPDAVLAEAVGGGLTWLPFALYLGAWVVLVGATAYLLRGATASEPARWLPAYMPLVWTGVGLTALGPVLSIGVWLVARAGRSKDERQGLFASAMTRGALAAFFGVLLWIAGLYALDLYTTTGGL